jgi:dUTP pyrophosphatase
MASMRVVSMVNAARTELENLGAVVYDPGRSWIVSGSGRFGDERPPLMTDDQMRTIRDVCRYAASQCDVLVAVLPYDIPTIGVVAEIYQAKQTGTPVIVYSDHTPGHVAFFGDLGTVITEIEDLSDALISAFKEAANPLNKTAPLPVLVGAGGRMPSQGYPDDAGFDLYVSERTEIPARGSASDDPDVVNPAFVDVPCAVSVELPAGTWALITGRSSTIRKRGLLVVNSIIDAGYRGTYFAACQNMTDRPVVIEAGERIAQFIVLPALAAGLTPVQVPELAPSARGSNGFGSSGK